MITVEIDPILLDLDTVVRRDLLDAFDGAIGAGVAQVKRDTARFDGDLRAGYSQIPAQFEGDEIVGTLQNTTPNSLYRERGRGPGKFPPYGQGTSLNRWARAKGIPPYLIARKIATLGTDRWIENTNALGIDRTSTTDDIKPLPGGVVAIIPEDIENRTNRLKY